MLAQNRILQVLGIPHGALISVIFCMMVLSFPVGAYVVFNSEIGGDITYEYPMDTLDLFLAGIGFGVPVEFELGDGFIVIWSTFLILFSFAGIFVSESKGAFLAFFKILIISFVLCVKARYAFCHVFVFLRDLNMDLLKNDVFP